MSDFFSKDFVDKTQKELQEREKDFGGDKRQKMEGGVHDLYLNNVESDITKEKVPVVKITANVEEEAETFRDLVKSFFFDDKDTTTDKDGLTKIDRNKKNLIEFMYKAFGYNFKPGDLKSIVKQMESFKGKKFRAAVQVRQSLYRKKDASGNLTGIIIFEKAEIYYPGLITQELSFKEENKFKKLKPSEQQELEDDIAENPDRYDENGKLKNTSAPAAENDAEDPTAENSAAAPDEIETPAPASAKQPATAGKAKPAAPAAEKKTPPPPPAAAPKAGGDDLPWD